MDWNQDTGRRVDWNQDTGQRVDWNQDTEQRVHWNQDMELRVDWNQDTVLDLDKELSLEGKTKQEGLWITALQSAASQLYILFGHSHFDCNNTCETGLQGWTCAYLAVVGVGWGGRWRSAAS